MTAAETVLGPTLAPTPGQLSWENMGWQEPPVSLVSEGSFGAMGVLADAKGYFVVRVEPPPAHYRGRFGLFLEEAIEAALEDRGALPPGIQSTTGLDASLADQLYRTRLLGYAGLAIGVPNLESIANMGRVLDADDSSVLRWWIAASADRPVRLLIHDQNACLRVYQAPVMFDALFGVLSGPVSPRAPSVEMAESAETMELSDLPPRVASDEFETSVAGTATAIDDDPELMALDRALGLDVRAEEDEPRSAPTIAAPPDDETPIVQASMFVDNSDTDVAEPWLRAEELSPSEVALVSSPSPQRVEAAKAFASALELEPGAVEAKAAPLQPETTPGMPQIRLSAADFFAAKSGEPRHKEPLIQDSRASGVAQELDVEVPSESQILPTPLPTKKIERNPFVRFAEAHEGAPAVVVSAEDSFGAATSSEREPVEFQADDLSELPVKVVSKVPAAPQVLVHESIRSDEDEDEEFPASEEHDAPAPLKVALPAGERRPSAAESEREAAFIDLAKREWKNWFLALDAAKGPKPLSAIERMFVTNYTRLVEAHRLGVADDSVLPAVHSFRDSFAESYAEAFDALRARGKRPNMVLDLPDMAHRIGRLQGARRVQLLLVDGLRFDLGLMVQDRLKRDAEATLTERLLLWSALPTCTSYQLELLGRGPEGLKEPGDPEEPPALVARGRAAMTPRRVRTGSLELFKLDVVEDELRELGAPVQERLPHIADRTAEAVLEFFRKQPPKTLVVVFGDHGFALDPSKAGTLEEVHQGGSSPEEVLVPAFAWLTGRVH